MLALFTCNEYCGPNADRKHGLFANRLFPPGEQGVKDKAGYLAVANSLHMHYRPEGFMEEFWVEKIAIEALRLA
jgi:hypothetical protein